MPEKNSLRTTRDMRHAALAVSGLGIKAAAKGSHHSINLQKLPRVESPQFLYRVCSEHQRVEQTDHALLFRRIIGLTVDDQAVRLKR